MPCAGAMALGNICLRFRTRSCVGCAAGLKSRSSGSGSARFTRCAARTSRCIGHTVPAFRYSGLRLTVHGWPRSSTCQLSYLRYTPIDAGVLGCMRLEMRLLSCGHLSQTSCAQHSGWIFALLCQGAGIVATCHWWYRFRDANLSDALNPHAQTYPEPLTRKPVYIVEHVAAFAANLECEVIAKRT